MRNRRVTIQTLVGPRHVIIFSDELPKQPFKMTLAEHNHMVQQLST